MNFKSILMGIVLAFGSTSVSANVIVTNQMLLNNSVLSAVHSAVSSIDAEESAADNAQEPADDTEPFTIATLDSFLQNKSNVPFKYGEMNPEVMKGISYCYGAVDAMYEQYPLETYTSLSNAVKKLGNHTGTIKNIVQSGHDDVVEMNSGYYSDMVFSKCKDLVDRVEIANE